MSMEHRLGSTSLKSEDANRALGKVELAIANLLKFKDGDAPPKFNRKHQRYAKKFLMAHIGVENGREFYDVPLIDVSAGGMKVSVPLDNPLDVGSKIFFNITKDSAQTIMRGLAEIVRVEKFAEDKQFGIKFAQVNS